MPTKKALRWQMLSFNLGFVRTLRKALIVLAVAFSGAVVPAAFADEHPSALQTALTSTTVSGGDIPPDFGLTGVSDSPPVVGTSDDFAAPSVSFSPSSVPEPSSIGLFATGILALTTFANFQRRKCRVKRDATVQ